MCNLNYPKLGFSDQKAVHKVDNVLLPDLLHHNNLIDDQLLHVPGGGRKGPIDQRRIRVEWVQRSEDQQRGMGTKVRVIMDLLGLL